MPLPEEDQAYRTKKYMEEYIIGHQLRHERAYRPDRLRLG